MNVQVDKAGCNGGIELFLHFGVGDIPGISGRKDLVNLSLSNMENAIPKPLKRGIQSSTPEPDVSIIQRAHVNSLRSGFEGFFGSSTCFLRFASLVGPVQELYRMRGAHG